MNVSKSQLLIPTTSFLESAWLSFLLSCGHSSYPDSQFEISVIYFEVSFRKKIQIFVSAEKYGTKRMERKANGHFVCFILRIFKKMLLTKGLIKE